MRAQSAAAATEGTETIAVHDIADKIFGPQRMAGIASDQSNRAMNSGAKLAIEHTGVSVECFWMHTEFAPAGHAGADQDECPVCTPLLGLEEADWPDGMEPGYGHTNCDCWRRYVERGTGRRIGEPGDEGPDDELPGAVAAKSMLPELRRVAKSVLKARYNN